MPLTETNRPRKRPRKAQIRMSALSMDLYGSDKVANVNLPRAALMNGWPRATVVIVCQCNVTHSKSYKVGEILIRPVQALP